MRTAVLSTQSAADAFKALEEDDDYASNLEEAQALQAERQSIAEKLQKDLDTLSQEEEKIELFPAYLYLLYALYFTTMM